MIQKLSRFIAYHSKLILFAAVLLLIPSVFGAIGTRVNYDILSYLPEDLDSSKGEKVLENTFHNAATTMLIVEGMPEQYTADLRDTIEEIPGVKSAVWVSNLMDISVPKEILPEDLRNLFYSPNADSTMMVVQYEHGGASDETRGAIAQIYDVCNEKCFLAGFSVVTDDIAKLVEKEMPTYVVIAVILSLIAMLFSIEAWALPFIFLLGIGMAILYNMGTNLFLGEISYITKAIVAILQLGVSMDYSIFLVQRYNEEKLHCTDHREAMAKAIEGAFLSLFGSSMTTVAGFLALCFMRLTLGRDLGIVMAKGVVLGVLTVVIVLPALVLHADGLIQRTTHRDFMPDFSRITNFAISHYKVLTVVFLVLFIPAFWMQKQVKMYYDLTLALPEDMPSIVATNKMKEQFNMASTHFVIIDDSIPSVELEEMEQQIEELDGIEALLGYDKFVGAAIPDEFIPQEVKDICKTDGKQMLMINSRYKTASDEVNAQVDELTRIVKSYDPNALITGEGAMTKDLLETAATDFNVTNYISIAAILVIVGIVFKSFTIPVVLVAAIELAIFLNMSCSWMMGTVIPFISPTVISCIQLGATVDYAILMTTRFREELQKGEDRFQAIRVAASTSTHSILTSSLVLFCATCGVGIISKIEIISSICTMLARGSVISALVSLLLLPAILLAMEPFFARTTHSWPQPAAQDAKH